MTEQICFLDAMEIAEKIRSKSLSPVEVLNAHLERIEKLNPKKAVTAIYFDGTKNNFFVKRFLIEHNTTKFNFIVLPRKKQGR